GAESHAGLAGGHGQALSSAVMKTSARCIVTLGSLCLLAGSSCGGSKGASEGTGGAAAGSGSRSRTAGRRGGGGTTGGGARAGAAGPARGRGGAGGGGRRLSGGRLASLGTSHVLVGASMQGAPAKAARFDGRYEYISGGIFDSATPCASCKTSCTAAGASCAV